MRQSLPELVLEYEDILPKQLPQHLLDQILCSFKTLDITSPQSIYIVRRGVLASFSESLNYTQLVYGC